jgi:hypothetical protein
MPRGSPRNSASAACSFSSGRKGGRPCLRATRYGLALPGGGGFGDPYARDPQRVIDDVLDGLITAEEARRDYGVAIDAQGRLDLIETKRLRTGDRTAADDRAEHGGGRGPGIS